MIPCRTRRTIIEIEAFFHYEKSLIAVAQRFRSLETQTTFYVVAHSDIASCFLYEARIQQSVNRYMALRMHCQRHDTENG